MKMIFLLQMLICYFVLSIKKAYGLQESLSFTLSKKKQYIMWKTIVLQRLNGSFFQN